MLEFQNVSFSYGKQKIFDGISFTLQRGEILAVMGPSGCGKSTLLNLVAGLRKPERGKICSDAKQISYVFQEPRLFPWLTVKENIRAVVKKDDISENGIQKILETVELSDAGDLYPAALSGGMKSRASLARALAYGSDLFLFDEPFAALDEKLRATLAVKIRDILKNSGASAIFVTHQSADALAFADRILEL